MSSKHPVPRTLPRLSLALLLTVIFVAALVAAFYFLPKTNQPSSNTTETTETPTAEVAGWSGAWGALQLVAPEDWTVNAGQVWQATTQGPDYAAVIELSYPELSSARTSTGTETTIAGVGGKEFRETERYMDGTVEKSRTTVTTEATKSGVLLRAVLTVESATTTPTATIDTLVTEYRSTITKASL